MNPKTASGEPAAGGSPPDAAPSPPPAGGDGLYWTHVRAGFWIVDPGVAKQSQDWVYAGPEERRAAAPRRLWWPIALATGLGVLSLLLGAALLVPATSTGVPFWPAIAAQPLAGGLVAAGALYLVIGAVLLGRRLLERRPVAHRARAWPPPDGPAGEDITHTEATAGPAGEDITHTEATGDAAGNGATVVSLPGGTPAPPLAAPDEPITLIGAAPDADLADEAAAGRQAWEGAVTVAGPLGWPDRPVVLAIGDGVSAGLRSAEISRLATRVAWHRTYYHLHALASGTPPTVTAPWMVEPHHWPPPGPARDQLLTQALTRAFGDTNTAVILAGQEHRRQTPNDPRVTATTLSLLAVDGSRYYLVHIGDCSVYHVHASTGVAAPRQVEHNRAAQYAQGDSQRYAEARQRRWHNILTRWLGMDSDWARLQAQVLEPPGQLSRDDSLVLCSDGLDKHVDPTSVALAALHLDAAAAAHRLVGLANDRGGTDHIAVAVLQTRPAAPGLLPLGARLALWREAAGTAFRRYRSSVVTLGLAGPVTAILVALAFVVAGAAGDPPSGSDRATPTALPTASPFPVAETSAAGAAAGPTLTPPPARDAPSEGETQDGAAGREEP